MDLNQAIKLSNEHLLICLAPGVMAMPGTASYVEINDDKSSQKILEAIKAGQSPYLFSVMFNPETNEAPDGFFRVGVIAGTESTENDSIVILRGFYRAELISLKRINGDDWNLWMATVKKIEDENHDDYFIQSHQHVMSDMIKIRDLLGSFLNRARGVYGFEDRLMKILIENFENRDWGDKDAVDSFIWTVVHSIPDIFQDEKQPILESVSLPERIDLCIKVLKSRLKLLEIQREKISKDNKPVRVATSVRISDKKEKGSGKDKSKDEDEDEFIEGAHKDIKKQWAKFNKISEYMSEDARRVVTEDVKRLMSFGDPQSNSYEWPKFMGRLEFILDLPWKEETVQESDIVKVAQVLDEDHYGLSYVKDSICDQLAPKLLNPEGKGHILCLVGPPGVGKTSLAKSVARALGRKYIRMSLGGVRDEAQIRGHKITYIGSEAGEILKEMKRCGVKNPVFVVDEIDKLGNMSHSGDPASAMLEVFDPEQNNSFKDHYTACGFDLSKVMFIATANIEDNIIPPLRDRMDILRLPGYLEVEKKEIANRYLIQRWMREVGLTKNNIDVQWDDGVVSSLIRGYTREAGVRNLERTIATILRKISRVYLKSRNEEKPVIKFIVTQEQVHKYLGPPKFFGDQARTTMIGEAVGLAWTPVGGDILIVQAEMYPMLQDKKVLARTGMQGDVMKESDEVAMTVLKNLNPTLCKKLSENAIHLHTPEGAVPKDGPSAGVTIVTALYSELENRPVKQNLAMTGEIDLKANVLPVGGIKEKIVAAERAGIKEIIMPKDNERNLHDVPKEVKDKLRFHFVETIGEVIKIAFPDPA